MHSIKEGAINHGCRKRLEEMRCLKQIIHALVYVPDKYHRSIRLNSILTSRKGSGCHVVLHDLNAVFILEVDAGHLIKSHYVPQSYKADLSPPHVVKQICNCGLSTGNQNGIRRQLLIDMRFTGSSRSQLANINIVFYQRNQSSKQMPFYTVVKLRRFHTAGTEQQIYPLFLCKLTSCLNDLALIQVRHLDRCDLADYKRTVFLFVLIVKICQINDAPDTASKQFFV